MNFHAQATSEKMHFHAQATSESGSQLVTNQARGMTCLPPMTLNQELNGFAPTASSLYMNMSAPNNPDRLFSCVSAMPRAAASIVEDHLRVERNRLETFSDSWPRDCPVHPKDLAAAGFYYMGPSDVVRCAFCQGTLKEWALGDKPQSEHEKFFPQCPFVRRQDVGNVPLLQQLNLLSPLREFPLEYRNQLFPALQRPQCEHYGDVTSRQESFAGHRLPAGQTAQELAEAGFFYLGPEDNVKCYYCGGSLKCWKLTDKPWTEHLRWFPHCPMLQIQFQALKVGEMSEHVPENVASVSEQHHLPDVAPSSETRRNAAPVVPTTVEEVSREESSPMPMEISESYSKDTEKLPLKSDNAASSSLPAVVAPELLSKDALHGLQAENQRLKDSILCKICMDADVNTLFLPCGHLVACDTCAPNLRQCPMCRVDIRGSIRTYIA